MFIFAVQNKLMFDIILSFITAFMLTYLAIPSIINVARLKNLNDEPGDRTSHTSSVPTLGGLGIFAGFIFSVTFWTPFVVFGELQYILCAIVIIFLIGAKDDIVPMSPRKKIIGQILAAMILVFKADVKLTSLHGLFGYTLIPDLVAIPLSLFTIIVIINSINLIDGINGLSGSVGVVTSTTLGYWFFQTNQLQLAVIAFALSGSLIAFLKYNFTPAKIFMGDTGSLIVGLVMAILAITFIEMNKGLDHPYALKSVPAVAIGVLIIPLFDTLRVFTIRILKGKSPFSPDRNHIHHLLLDLNLSHMQATGVLITFNIIFIGLVYRLQHLGSFYLIILVFLLATALSTALYVVARPPKKLSS